MSRLKRSTTSRIIPMTLRAPKNMNAKPRPYRGKNQSLCASEGGRGKQAENCSLLDYWAVGHRPRINMVFSQHRLLGFSIQLLFKRTSRS